SGSQIVGLHVVPNFPQFAYEVPGVPLQLSDYEKACARHAEKALNPLDRRSKAAGVECKVRYVFSDNPAAEIVRVARRDRCDLIVMASHGRRGLSAVLLGSETQKVLTHSPIPVLVVR
ncbi:MAG TPA: universal stress protein, partial [Rudaea sp.]